MVIHLKDPLDDDPPPPREDRSGPPPPQAPEASMSYVAYFRGDKEDPRRPDHVPVQRRPGIVDRLAAHGCVRAEARPDRRRHAQPRRPLPRDRQRVQSDRCQRPGVRRCAGHRLRPPAGRRQGEGLLRRRPGRPCVRQLHRRIPVASQAMELAQVPVRRELRDDPCRGARAHSRERQRAGLERRDSALAGIEFRRQRRRAAVQSRASICRTCWRSRPTRRRRGTTTSCPSSPRRSSRCCARSRPSPSATMRRRSPPARRSAPSASPRSRPNCRPTPVYRRTTSSARICG